MRDRSLVVGALWLARHAWRLLVVVVACATMLAARADAADAVPLRVMTLNLWHGGDAGNQPLPQTVKVIRAAQADVVGLQETAGVAKVGERPDNARRIAEMLGWHYLDQGERTGIISRHPITGSTPRKVGAAIELQGGRRVWLFNVHLIHKPYQPYQLLKIPYENAPFVDDAAGAVSEAHKARDEQVTHLLAEVKGIERDGTPIFITGDFNEPSVLDWTDAVAQAGRCPLAVAWPTTQSVLAAGFRDAYRQLYPDPLARPGYTWTTVTAEDDSKDHHDRIDFVFVGGRETRITSALVVGEKRERADIVVSPYPSDHRSVVVEVDLP